MTNAWCTLHDGHDGFCITVVADRPTTVTADRRPRCVIGLPKPAPPPTIERVAIINGEDAVLRLALNATVSDLIFAACNKTGNNGHPASKWNAYTPAGTKLDSSSSADKTPYRVILMLRF